MSMHIHLAHARKGMTLIEAIVWIAVFLIAMIAIVQTLLYLYRTNRYIFEQANAISSAQRGLDRVVRTIRESAYSAEGAFPIVSITGNDFTFYADVDTDPLIERVRYYLQGTDLMRAVTEPTGNPPAYSGAAQISVVAGHVRNASQGVPVFRYYDKLGSEIINYTNWTSVRSVRATLIVNVVEETLPNQLQISSTAAIRNLAGR